MKKIILTLLFILIYFGIAYADRDIPNSNDCIYVSSFTKTNESGYLTNSAYLKSVVISSATVGVILKIYDSTYTAVNQIDEISFDNEKQREYCVYLTNGLYYVLSGNNNGCAIIYRKKR